MTNNAQDPRGGLRLTSGGHPEGLGRGGVCGLERQEGTTLLSTAHAAASSVVRAVQMWAQGEPEEFIHRAVNDRGALLNILIRVWDER